MSESEKKFREEQLSKVRNLQTKPQPPKPKQSGPRNGLAQVVSAQ